MLRFLPLITLTGGGSEGAGKYFIAQAGGSSIFMLSPVIWVLTGGVWTIIFFLVGLLLKLGSAPLHYWFSSVCRVLG